MLENYKIYFQSDNFLGLIDAIRIYFRVFYNSSVFHYPHNIAKIWRFQTGKQREKMYSGCVHVHIEQYKQ